MSRDRENKTIKEANRHKEVRRRLIPMPCVGIDRSSLWILDNKHKLINLINSLSIQHQIHSFFGVRKDVNLSKKWLLWASKFYPDSLLIVMHR